METTPDGTFVPSFASNKTNVEGSTSSYVPSESLVTIVSAGYFHFNAYLNVHLQKLRTGHIWIWHYYLHYSLSYS